MPGRSGLIFNEKLRACTTCSEPLIDATSENISKQGCRKQDESSPSGGLVLLAFELLEDAGLLFRRPADAARKLSEVWDDVDGWWTSTPVRSARQQFCELYNWTSGDLTKRVADALRRVVLAPPRP